MPEMICRKKNAAVINKLRHESVIAKKIVNNFESETLAIIEKWKELKAAAVFHRFACQAISNHVSSFDSAGVTFHLSYFKCEEEDGEYRFIFNVIFSFGAADANMRTGELCYSF